MILSKHSNWSTSHPSNTACAPRSQKPSHDARRHHDKQARGKFHSSTSHCRQMGKTMARYHIDTQNEISPIQTLSFPSNWPCLSWGLNIATIMYGRLSTKARGTPKVANTPSDSTRLRNAKKEGGTANGN